MEGIGEEDYEIRERGIEGSWNKREGTGIKRGRGKRRETKREKVLARNFLHIIA